MAACPISPQYLSLTLGSRQMEATRFSGPIHHRSMPIRWTASL